MNDHKLPESIYRTTQLSLFERFGWIFIPFGTYLFYKFFVYVKLYEILFS